MSANSQFRSNTGVLLTMTRTLCKLLLQGYLSIQVELHSFFGQNTSGIESFFLFLFFIITPRLSSHIKILHSTRYYFHIKQKPVRHSMFERHIKYPHKLSITHTQKKLHQKVVEHFVLNFSMVLPTFLAQPDCAWNFHLFHSGTQTNVTFA